MMINKNEQRFSKYIYWVSKKELADVKSALSIKGKKVSSVLKTPCETIKAKGDRVLVASPSVFSRVCKRQGSWYRESNKAGKYMLVSAQRLPDSFDRFLDVEISESSFQPKTLPSRRELNQLLAADEYRDQKPGEWENAGIKDSVMFKILFTLTGFWGWGDNLRKHWLNHRANHANFLSHQFTTEIDGKSVPYSVTDNDGVCSSCVEFFNIIDQSSRKLVRACPGAVTFAGVQRKIYYDVNPISIPLPTSANVQLQ